MDKLGPWAPITLVIAAIPFVGTLIGLLPETLPASSCDRAPMPDANPEAADISHPASFSLTDHIGRRALDLVASLTLLRNPNVLLVLPAFFLQNIIVYGYSATLTLYITTYFDWPLSRISLILSPLGLCHLIVLALLPRLSANLASRQFNLTAFSRDTLLARVSFAILAAAALAEGLLQSTWPFVAALAVGTLAAGMSPLSRAVLTHHVRPDLTSRLYVLVAVVEAVGSLFAGPGLAWCFSLGLARRGAWTGLPWFYISALCFVACLCLCLVRPPRIHAISDLGKPQASASHESALEQSSHSPEREPLLGVPQS